MSADLDSVRGGTADERGSIVVTGASAGLGYFAAEQLAKQGHPVVLAVRNRARGERAAAAIRSVVPSASLEILDLDLADLDSVRAAASSLENLGPIAAVLNNAGVVGAGQYRRTAQGFELQMGTNHLGHFLWTSLVLPALERTSGRVVHLGSIAHWYARLPHRDPLAVGHYVDHWQYAKSKLAVELFGFELAERLADSGSKVLSVVAHPGLSLNVLSPERAGILGGQSQAAWVRSLASFVTQGKDAGAVPLVHAAVGTDVRSGEYWGPGGALQIRGPAAIVRAQPHAHDRIMAARLWDASERATSASFALSPVT
jgi:NAD(P)-dependent dehydrogenase (short-subunit alcohol dehydrogenase family)